MSIAGSETEFSYRPSAVKEEDIYEILVESVKGYTRETVKTLIISIPQAVSAIQLMSSISKDDTEEEQGRILFGDVQKMIDAGGPVFRSIIENNSSVQQILSGLEHLRRNCQDELDAAESKAEADYVAPCDKELERIKSIEAEDIDEKLRAEGKDDDAINEAVAKHMNYLNRIHQQELNEYRELLKQRNQAKSTVRQLKTQMELLVVQDMVLHMFNHLLSTAAQKVIEAVKDRAALQTALKGTATLATNGSVVPNPLQNSSFPGMVALLHQRYHKKTFVNFATALIKAMSWSMSSVETINNPRKGINEVEKMYAIWSQQGYWDQMTQDMFWTAVLVKGMDMGAFRTKVLTKLRDVISDHERDAVKNPSNTELPIFRAITEFINTEQDDRKLDAEQRLLKNTTNNPNNGGASHRNPYRGSNINSYTKRTSENLEEAAAVTVDPPKVDRVFKDEVLEKDGVSVTDPNSGKTFPYKAVRELTTLCPMCFPVSGSPTPHPHGRTCYRSQCNKCHFYGHKGATCKQTHTSKGEPIA